MMLQPKDAIEALATAYHATKTIYRESNHSFTGYTLECHFDNPHLLISFVAECQLQIKHFVAIRILNENEAVASIPCLDLPF